MPLVLSAVIRRIEYDPVLRELDVTFRETGSYTYGDVPRRVYDEFLAATSKGQFFNEQIRDRYPMVRKP